MLNDLLMHVIERAQIYSLASPRVDQLIEAQGGGTQSESLGDITEAICSGFPRVRVTHRF